MATSEIKVSIRFKVPHPGNLLVLNLLGVLGLVAVVIAVGGLAGFLWGLLVAGVAMVTLCLIGYTYVAAGQPAASGVASTGPAVAVARSA